MQRIRAFLLQPRVVERGPFGNAGLQDNIVPIGAVVADETLNNR